MRYSGPRAPWVLGDIYRVDEDRVRLLDDFHGIPPDRLEGGHFRRVEALVYPFSGAGRVMHAWIWEWTGPLTEAVAVPSGDWMDVELPRTPPTLTKLAAGCMLAAPLCIGLAAMSSSRDLVTAFAVCGLTAPCVAAFANYFGGRRREHWRPLRIFLWYLFVGIALLAMTLGLNEL
jgi:gamma-glutamylcyclotransferase (GGCT)/AIG2-like uncharacterized protein YtfP